MHDSDEDEERNPIEKEFVQSWDWMEEFYAEIWGEGPFLAQVTEFMTAMRAKDYDKTLRAGQSLSWLILSRSRRHGMRAEQPCVVFGFGADHMKVINCIDDPNNELAVTYSGISPAPEIDELLKRLQSMPIT